MWQLTIYHDFKSTKIVDKLLAELSDEQETTENLEEELEQYWNENFQALQTYLNEKYSYELIKNDKTFIIKFDYLTSNLETNSKNTLKNKKEIRANQNFNIEYNTESNTNDIHKKTIIEAYNLILKSLIADYYYELIEIEDNSTNTINSSKGNSINNLNVNANNKNDNHKDKSNNISTGEYKINKLDNIANRQSNSKIEKKVKKNLVKNSKKDSEKNSIEKSINNKNKDSKKAIKQKPNIKFISTADYFELINNLNKSEIETLNTNSDYLTRYLISSKHDIVDNKDFDTLCYRTQELSKYLDINHPNIKDAVDYFVIFNIYNHYFNTRKESLKTDLSAFQTDYMHVIDLNKNIQNSFNNNIDLDSKINFLQYFNQLLENDYPFLINDKYLESYNKLEDLLKQSLVEENKYFDEKSINLFTDTQENSDIDFQVYISKNINQTSNNILIDIQDILDNNFQSYLGNYFTKKYQNDFKEYNFSETFRKQYSQNMIDEFSNIYSHISELDNKLNEHGIHHFRLFHKISTYAIDDFISKFLSDTYYNPKNLINDEYIDNIKSNQKIEPTFLFNHRDFDSEAKELWLDSYINFQKNKEELTKILSKNIGIDIEKILKEINNQETKDEKNNNIDFNKDNKRDKKSENNQEIKKENRDSLKVITDFSTCLKEYFIKQESNEEESSKQKSIEEEIINYSQQFKCLHFNYLKEDGIKKLDNYNKYQKEDKEKTSIKFIKQDIEIKKALTSIKVQSSTIKDGLINTFYNTNNVPIAFGETNYDISKLLEEKFTKELKTKEYKIFWNRHIDTKPIYGSDHKLIDPIALTIKLDTDKSISFIPANQNRQFKIAKTNIYLDENSFNYKTFQNVKKTSRIPTLTKKFYIKELNRFSYSMFYKDFYENKTIDRLLILLSQANNNEKLLNEIFYGNDYNKNNIKECLEEIFENSEKVSKSDIINKLNNNKNKIINEINFDKIENYLSKSELKAYESYIKYRKAQYNHHSNLQTYIKKILNNNIRISSCYSDIQDFNIIEEEGLTTIYNSSCNVTSYANNIIFKNLDSNEILEFCQKYNLINGVYKEVPEELKGFSPVIKNDYLNGYKLKLPENSKILHALTCAPENVEKVLEKIFESDGLESINIRSRKNSYLKGMSPIGDIASGIDKAIPFNISKNRVHGGGVMFILKEEVLYRRDIFFAPTDFGAGNRRDKFRKYAESLELRQNDSQIINLEDKFSTPKEPSHIARINHLHNLFDSSNELYIKDKISFDEVDHIVVEKQYEEKLKKLLNKYKLDIKFKVVDVL